MAICLSYGLLFSCDRTPEFSEPLPETVDFNFHVRPILVQNCYLCHGPDPSGRKADLRLDTYEGATAELKDGGSAIVPGKPSKSQLIYRITHEEEDQVMPPPETNHKLTEREKALLEKWIDQGAEWKAHWAFIKPEPASGQTGANTIDSLIEDPLMQKELQKTPMANRNTLIRRVSYLLTGLPPSPEAVESFVYNRADDAYEKMVDSYLNSPAYGERWARHWMDLVRYAETKGHEFDYPITGAWKYRDYLIRAFNSDVPYDQLLREHIAGDLLADIRYDAATGVSESQLGTAFYAMTEGTHSPVDVRQDEADRIDNMIDVTTKTFQGLTVSCAKCHDHKFDPILTADYYGLYGVMESTRFSPVAADQTRAQESTAKELQDLKLYMRKMVSEKWADKTVAQRKIVAQNSKPSIQNKTYKMLGDFRGPDFDGWTTTGLAFGQRTTLGNPLVDLPTGKLTGLDGGRASSRLLGTGIFGGLQSPNIILDTDFIGVRALGTKSTVRIVIDNFQLIQNPIYGNMQQGVDSHNWKNLVFDVAPWKGHKAYIEIIPGGFEAHDYKLPEDAFIEVQYAIAYDTEWPSTVPRKKSEKGDWASLDISPHQIDQLNVELKKGELPSRFPELKPLMDSSHKLAKELKGNSFFYGVADGFGINSPVFVRGSYKDPSEELVPRSFLSVLPMGDIPFKSKGSGRLELAQAMLHPDNPLTARVMANRIWHHLFGRGIVETVDNFGLQGKLPSHPELLDHLAVQFQNEGWSIKKMIRHIVSSETFKRSTLRNDELLKKDPDNIYLASFPVRRLEAEAIRDGLLATTESLDATLYGPPIATYLTDFMQGRGRPKQSGPLDGDGRRSIYQEVRRNFLEPMMITFDRPIPFSTFGKRNVTNVPSQSLIIMNDPFVAQQAEIMAEKLLSLGKLTFNQKIDWIYMRAFSRKPTAQELQKSTEFIGTLQKMEPPEEMGVNGEKEVWKAFCHSIFNLKEFIYLI